MHIPEGSRGCTICASRMMNVELGVLRMMKVMHTAVGRLGVGLRTGFETGERSRPIQYHIYHVLVAQARAPPARSGCRTYTLAYTHAPRKLALGPVRQAASI